MYQRQPGRLAHHLYHQQRKVPFTEKPSQPSPAGIWKEEEKTEQDLCCSAPSTLDFSSGGCWNILKGRQTLVNTINGRLLVQAESGDTGHRHKPLVCFSTTSDLHGTKSTHIACSQSYSVSKLCLTLCNSMDCSPPASSVHGISQARILEWAAISFSGKSSRPGDRTHISCVSCIGRLTLYHWAWEASTCCYWFLKDYVKYMWI